ncbi:MAG: phosphatase PAP2-related protein [Mucilaginibacter sp.]|uniref:phosphatase PAP2-related protein n=1 Tax=Mucilaginibacter sp. L3T2-6 TaxID=3062491 RepID=UPI0026759134|nr:phosphatase PAP2-related protein [Mucilaginibacter sp. L3T2-6]MDO3642404.1 phosphatase PAP2-related protein [Mucilaginibacter sp. L3T2-6]MDV6214899.1 phosphatase PAP2-related protein [Mucilaginibacter sp. L3T2-6]
MAIITFAVAKKWCTPMSLSVVKSTWKETWSEAVKRQQIIIGTTIMMSVVFTMPLFFTHIEKRQGTLIKDPVLAGIPPHDVSLLIFAIIWSMILLIIVRAAYKPSIYIIYCWALIPITLARFIAISIVPLEPPIGLQPLIDPLTGIFYGQHFITKDLFFSGHIATMTLIFLCLRKKTDRIIGFIATIAVAFLLLVQHIHYTIDILASPGIVYICYRLTRRFLDKELDITVPFKR